MPAKDRYHDTVVRALIKDGWQIVGEQVRIDVGSRRLLLDIEARRDTDHFVIIVEVKGFENMPSPMSYLADTVGQYVLYRTALSMSEISSPLYLAVPSDAYNGLLAEPLAEQVLADENIRMVIFEPSTEEIVTWIR